MNRNLSITAFLGFLAVVLGAFGAHALKARLSVEQLNTYEVGIRYQFYHVLVLLLLNMYGNFTQKIKNRLSLLFFIGIILFSGSIYLLSNSVFSSKILGPITPIGGLFLIAGWLYLLYSFLKRNEQ